MVASRGLKGLRELLWLRSVSSATFCSNWPGVPVRMFDSPAWGKSTVALTGSWTPVWSASNLIRGCRAKGFVLALQVVEPGVFAELLSSTGKFRNPKCLGPKCMEMTSSLHDRIASCVELDAVGSYRLEFP